MLTKTLLMLVIILTLVAPSSAQADCDPSPTPDDYAVTYTYHDGYTWAHVWYHGAATTIMGSAGRHLGNADGNAEWTAPDGQLVLVPAYPDDHYDDAPTRERETCGGEPIDDTDDAFPVEAGAFDAATGQTADVYIFTDDVLGERTEIPASVDASGALRLILQADQWTPGRVYAVLVDGVYAGRFTLGAAAGLIEWEAA